MFPDSHDSQIFEWFLRYAYEPEMVYAGILLFMYASSFGLPFPEEIVILAAGVVAFIANHPDLYPPPTPDSHGVNLYMTAAVCFFGVFSSDLVIYSLGRFFGPKLLKKAWFIRMVGPELLTRVMRWMKKYGFWASGIFRFMPGLRFPGHLACGMTKVPLHKFIAVDGGAALVSVPTQILLVGIYGETVLKSVKDFKMVLMALIAVVISYFLFRWLRRRYFIAQRKAS